MKQWFYKVFTLTAVSYTHLLSYSSEDCAEIDCLGVKKSFQGQGIGRELITTIEREAVKQVDYLQAVSYTHLGFEAITAAVEERIDVFGSEGKA